MFKILIAEDDANLRKGLEVNLKCEGYQIVSTGRGDAVLHLVLKESPDLLLLDIGLPGTDGFDLCRQMRQQGLDLQIIFLTGRNQEIDRILGLELGGDDYVTKPFSERELISRIHARLRRASNKSGNFKTYTFGDVTVDFTRFQANKGGEPLELTAREFEILRYLIQHVGSVVSREQLLRDVWGYEDCPLTRTIDSHMLKLRKKLEEDPAVPKHIQSLYGVGYRFVP